MAIFLSAYWLYWQGEIAIDNASGKFTTIGFENTNLNCNKLSLNFFIENNKHISNDYQIKISSNDKEVLSKSISILPSENKIIELDSKTVENICQEKTPFKFKVSIKNVEESQTIYKIINNNK